MCIMATSAMCVSIFVTFLICIACNIFSSISTTAVDMPHRKNKIYEELLKKEDAQEFHVGQWYKADEYDTKGFFFCVDEK